jgi:transglutaminase-like putative cysteine protease
MKQIALIFIVQLFCTICNAQQNNYAAFTIPDSLKKDADVVVREEYIKFIIKDINSAKYEVHKVITILNENGKGYLNFNEFSSKFRVLDDAEIKVYDVLGIKKNTYSKKEMTTVNYGEGLVPEGKVTYFSVNAHSYPFTIEINYVIKYKGILSYPDYFFQHSDQSVQHSVLEVEVPTNLSLRYKIQNCKYQPAITHDDKNDYYRWEVKNIGAFKYEKYCGAFDNYLPRILLAPNKFQLDDYEGDMTSWKNFGTWINNLYSTTVSLPEERKIFYQAMVKDAPTNIEKAKILYSYMQNNMRYVSIQLGIGGLRPFKASFVDEKKYGDCKALSNYLKSALDAVGVKANVVIIEGDMRPSNVLEDFPDNYFNHAILCIPQPKDSIWLECTSTTLPFAELGPFTENRKAMMVTENGGVLVSTPLSNFKNNAAGILTNIDVDTDGGAKITTAFVSRGAERNYLLMGFHDMKEDERRRYFISGMEWKQPDVIDITTSGKTENPYVVTAKMDYEKIYSFKAGSKYFFEPRLYPIFDEEIPETEKRIRDYYFTYPYQSADTTVYHLPANFSIETLPKDKAINLPFAAYSCTYKWDAAAHTVNITALLQIKERVVKAADYKKLLDFKKQVLADVNEKIVVKKD